MWSPSPDSCSIEDSIHPFQKHFLSISYASTVQDVSKPGSALKEHAMEEGSQDKYTNIYATKKTSKTKKTMDTRERENGQALESPSSSKTAGAKAMTQLILGPEPGGPGIIPSIK